MRVALISWESLHSVAVGGIAAHVSELAAALAKAGDEVHVITRLGPGQRTYKFVEGVHYHRCAYESRPDFIDDVNSMCGAFVDCLWQIEDFTGPVDVVHGHDWLATKACVWARQGRGKKVVMTIHSTEFGRCGNEFKEDAWSKAIRDYEWEAQYHSDAVIAVSRTLRDEIVKIYQTPPEKVSTIYNGVNPHRYDGFIDQGDVKKRCGIGPLNPMVLFVGRMAWQKGPDNLLAAAPSVLAAHPQARFAFVGEGDMRCSLEERSASLGLGHAVRFLGQRGGQNLVNIFRAADVVCVPSRNEPFGIVILEAWSSGKALVATMNGGPNEFVWHGVTGLKTTADANGVAGALNVLLDNPEYALWMGNNGRVAVETTFSWDHIAERTRDLYRSVLAA